MQPFTAAFGETTRATDAVDRLGVRHIGEIVPAVLARYRCELDGSHDSHALVEDPPVTTQKLCICTEGDHVSAFTEDIGRNRD
jgi:hypothetical protein